ncbi:MAG: hypothetical protein ACYTGQ_02945 [Planctomycetota bacterium]
MQTQVSYGSNVGTQILQHGGLNFTSSSLTINEPFGDSRADAFATLSDSGFIPTLRANAVSDGTHAQASAWGVQGYTNTSAEPLDTTLMLNLTADITGANDLDARIYLFEDDNFQFSFDSGTILFESPSQLWPGFVSNSFTVLLGNHTGAVEETRAFPFTVAPGDGFYIWAQLLATADNPGQVDAFNTLTASFTNTVGLAPAATSFAIPEPTSLAFLGLAMMRLFRRDRHASNYRRPFASTRGSAGS